MPAKTEKQRNLMMAALDCKKKDCSNPTLRKIAKSMTVDQLKHFRHVETVQLNFKNFLELIETDCSTD
jgi:hypothetical protein